MSEFSTPELRTEHGAVVTHENPTIPTELGTSFPYKFRFVVRGLPTLVIVDKNFEGRVAMYLFGGDGNEGTEGKDAT